MDIYTGGQEVPPAGSLSGRKATGRRANRQHRPYGEALDFDPTCRHSQPHDGP